MEIITKYRAYNGMEFNDSQKCEEYEEKCRKADAIIARLPEKPDGCEFANGSGYIQHEAEVFFKVREDLLRQAYSEYQDKWLIQSIDDKTAHPSWASRVISECCTNQLDRAWDRICCTDKDLREWGQIYYANNPSEATQQKLN